MLFINMGHGHTIEWSQKATIMARYHNAFSIKSLLIDLLLKDSYTKADIGSERKRMNVTCLCVVET